MIQANELLTLIFSIGLWVFIISHKEQMKKIPYYKLFLIAVIALTFAWVSSILEGFVWLSVMDMIKHFSSAISSLFFAVWGYHVFTDRYEVSE